VTYPPLPYFSPIPLWNDHRIDVQAALVPKYLWTTASIDVYLDGVCILRTGGKLRPTGLIETAFTDAAGMHRVALTWGVGWLRQFPFVLYIDGEVVAHSRVRVSNWPLGMLVWLLILTVGITIPILKALHHH
jgi:hypothetical protein